MAYVLVDDIKAATAKARPLGANVMKDSVEDPGRRRLQRRCRPDRDDARPVAGQEG
jgi:hypothetical protein